MLPVHWATFNLAYHDWEEPIVRTLAAAAEKVVNVVHRSQARNILSELRLKTRNGI